MYQNQGIAQDPSKVGGVVIAADELQKELMGLEERVIGLKMRLIPVMRPETAIPASDSVAPKPPYAPLEDQLRSTGAQVDNLTRILAGILEHLEV